jgi:hypothetical protein
MQTQRKEMEMKTTTHETTRRISLLSLCAAGAMLAASVAVAGPGMKSSAATGAQAQYQIDRAACLSGNTHQDRATCLREAGAALVEARRGGLTEASDSVYTQNAMARCVAHPNEDQEDCVRRMSGEGVIVGSVEEGAIFRELTRTVPAE